VKITTLSIGDELIYGEVQDSNAASIAARLYNEGLKVQRHLAVGDSEPDIVEALQLLSEKSEAVIITGGLGPTVDDITARAAAKLAGRRLVLSEEALLHLKAVSEKLGGNVHPQNDKQALLPTKSTLIPNPLGTACGFYLTHNGHYLFFLPGVPAEMSRMLDETVLPFILQRAKHRRLIMTRRVKVFGISEAEIDFILKDLVKQGGGISLAFCVVFPEIFLTLRAEGERETEVTAMLQTYLEQLREKLRGYIYAEDEETMDSVVARMFREKGLSVAVAESCTGGLVAKRLTDIPGSSSYFREGVISYSDAAKTNILQVPSELISQHGAVSVEVAKAMAKGMRKLAGTDLALAVTGIAGPDGGSEAKPVGTVFIALASSAGCQAKMYRFYGDRNEIRTITAFMAMDWLRRQLQLH
jgi:nicotinamide-nucleotide amidase